jgi:hypothetical protein
MEGKRISETPVNFYQTTLYSNPEDSHLHTDRRKNPKPRNILGLSLAFNVTACEHKVT